MPWRVLTFGIFCSLPYHRSFHFIRRRSWASILFGGLHLYQSWFCLACRSRIRLRRLRKRRKTPSPAFFSSEFRERLSPPPRWFDGGQSYIETEPGTGEHGHDVVKYDTATSKKREVLITTAQLTPAGAKEPLDVAGLSWSKDNQRVLIFTNTRRVWRTNSRGDYWFLDRT